MSLRTSRDEPLFADALLVGIEKQLGALSPPATQ
jgi:hypothetical protein